MRYGIILSTLFLCVAYGETTVEPIHGLRARIKPMVYHVPVGQPVWATMTIENSLDESVTLTVPGAEPSIPDPEIGLPLSHVFSGGKTSGVEVTTGSGRSWERPVGYRQPKEAPILLLAPHSTVGTMIDLREYFPALRTAGAYTIVWRPYGGGAVSEPVHIDVAPQQRVQLVTDDGTLTIDLFYEDAPETVANFLDLVESGFYTGQAFHRLEPGYMIQGGCARGDGTGVRLDGKRIPFEHNERHSDKGSVAMALLGDDPDSASSQFFIGYNRQKNWDGRYTIFGHLTGEESYETLDRLMGTEVDDDGKPRRTLYIRAARAMMIPSAPPGSYP